jgi:Spy/CpxP family protein refolding chaperone
VKTWKAILAALVIFVAGAVTGGVVTWQTKLPLKFKSAAKPSGNAPVSPWMLQRPDFAQRIHRDLGLTDQQTEKIESILAKSRQRTGLLWETLREPLQEELSQVKAEIRALLTPEQSAKFDEIIKPRSGKPPEHPGWHRKEGPKPGTNDQPVPPPSGEPPLPR